MKIDVTVDFEAVARGLATELPKQLPFAMALTLTRLAQDATAAVVAQLPVVFDRPTAFTTKAVTFERATKVSQFAVVQFRQSEAASGRSKNEHIRPGAEGTAARAQKKTEFLLTRLGALPAGWVTVPGKAMPLDGFGNLAGSYYKQIVNVLQLKAGSKYASGKAVSGASQKRAKRMSVAAEIFAVTPGANALAKGGGWLPPGVYKHMPGRKLLQMLKFVRKATYTQRLDMPKVVTETVAKNLQSRWDEAAAQTLATQFKGKA